MHLPEMQSQIVLVGVGFMVGFTVLRVNTAWRGTVHSEMEVADVEVFP